MAAEAFNGWHRPPEIIPRRNAEKRLFRDDAYLHGGMAMIYAADANGRVDWSGGARVNALELLSGAAGEDGRRQPDDPGPQLRPENKVGRNAGWVGAIGAAAVALLTFLGKLALWIAVIGAGYLAWRYRARIKRFFRRIAGRGQ